jgi:hypothetical protein
MCGCGMTIYDLFIACWANFVVTKIILFYSHGKSRKNGSGRYRCNKFASKYKVGLCHHDIVLLDSLTMH